MRLFSLLVVLVVFAQTAHSQLKPAAKAVVPDAAAQKAAAAIIADVYKPDYEKAKTSPQKIELAKKLFQEGEATKDDAVARFVLFRVARDIAAQQGDLLTALNIVNRMAGEFDVDRLQMQLDVAVVAAKAPKLAKDHLACVALLTPLMEEAIAADRYE